MRNILPHSAFRAFCGLLVILQLPLVIAACTTPRTRIEPDLLDQTMPFLQLGETSREEVYFRLGDPFRRYEDGRLVTYQMRRTDFGDLQKVQSPRMQWGGDEFGETLFIYSLVLAFDAQDRLSSRSLVLIR